MYLKKSKKYNISFKYKNPMFNTISYINVQKSTDFKPQEMKERKKEF